jgi:hypothetical protein
VVGSWKLGKLVSVAEITDTVELKTIAAQRSSSDLSGRDLKTVMVDADKGNFSKFADAYPDIKDVMEFKADNTANLTIHGKVISGSWKMNKNKNGIVFTESGKTKTIKISIAKVDNNTMLIDEKTRIGSIRLLYNNDIKK